MHGFPPAPDLHFLIGKQLGQVCLDPHSVQLHFWNGGGIHIGMMSSMDRKTENPIARIAQPTSARLSSSTA
ncbi:hypothetical protein CVO77_15635 [Sphingopyxis lindanitolerans]|uniref:Uncharacterized protein n=1 Tax=Sphingopyxis lindanitolerans TaxID=2054227 RepID=A0A2S8B288_9SPHN|nr:hypothetical protein CVO77_15635 [Sphingopyxis lindanitolerans]